MTGQEPLADLFEQAYEAVRAFNHRTHGAVITPPDTYGVLGVAKQLAAALPQAFAQLAGGLSAAAEQFDLYDGNRLPAVSVDQCAAALRAAAEQAEAAYLALERAQTAINFTGVNTDADGELQRRPGLRVVD